MEHEYLKSIISFRDFIERIKFFAESMKYQRQKHFYAVFFITVLIVSSVSAGVFFYQKNEIIKKENILKSYFEEITGIHEFEEKEMVLPKIKVYICGYVQNPGVYELEEGARLADLLYLCGGASGNAALEAVNLAALLKDSDMVYIPSKEDIETESINYYELIAAKNTAATGQGFSSASSENGFKININTASSTELQKLPGIGPKTAESIIEYRQKQGHFKSTEEIKRVKGIGEKKYESIKELISV